MAKNKILIHSIVFSPDGVSTAYLYNDIALRFQKEGYEVVVLSTTPHYNVLQSELSKQPLHPKLLGLYYVSDYQGIKIIHVSQKKFKNSLLRIIGFVYWHILAFFLGLAEKNIKIILSPSPPLTIGVLNIFIALIKKAKVIYNVQEIYPDFLINQGKLKMNFLISLLKKIERFVYKFSDAITTIDAVFYHTIISRVDQPQKLKVIPNFVDIDIFKPLTNIPGGIDENIFPLKNTSLKLMYAGNIGHAQNWKPLLELAKRMRTQNVEFWVIGEGVMKKFLEEKIKNHALKNIHLVPYQKREYMPNLIAYADLHFIFMSPEMEGQGFPSKVYTIMACAKPLLVISGKGTPIINFLEPVGCAWLIHAREVGAQCSEIIDLINKLLVDKSQLEILGNRGLQMIETSYTKDAVTMEYVNLSNNLINN